MNPQAIDWTALKKSLTRHPFVVLAVICLFITAVFDVTQERLVSGEMLIALLGFLLAFCIISYCTTRNHPYWKNYNIILWALGFLSTVSLGLVFIESKQKIISLMIIGFAFLGFVVLFWFIRKELTVNKIIFLIAAAGFLMRVGYILYTGVEVRQHDVWNFGGNDGHAGYIEYLYYNLHLPDFDPRTRWQFYHPPLHHILTAAWLKLNTFLGFTWERAKENIQILSLFYSSCSMLLSYKIFRALGLKKLGLIGAFSIVAFHPTFLLMSGSVNNDILSITLMLGAIYTTICWYQQPTMINILKIALCVGFAMMAKLSGGLVAPAIALVFAVKLFTEKQKWKSYLVQFFSFGGVCIPLALWWGVRNWILYKVPIAYVPRLDLNADQYIGGHTVLERLLDFSPFQFQSVYTSWGDPYHEYNVFIGLFKTSLSGEFKLTSFNPDVAKPSVLLFYINIILVLIALVAMAVFLFRKNSLLDPTKKGFLFVLYASTLASYVKFCFDFPHTCTQNMRYATPTIVIGALFVGFLIEVLNKSPKKSRKYLSFAVLGVVGLFAVASTTVYILLGRR